MFLGRHRLRGTYRYTHNAKSHVPNVVRTDLNQVNVATMNWPARSPDLNPIEYLYRG
jgi:hypothetical protein